MEIRLGRTCFVVGAILFVGYIMIFISVVLQSTSSTSIRGSLTALQDELTVARSEVRIKDAEVINARIEASEKEKQIEKLQATITQYKALEVANKGDGAHRPGVIILGMHRSGTSIVGGLINKMGLNTGGPLIRPAEDNEKGFFERIDVVLQNDELMKRQNVHYAYNTHAYDASQGIKDALTLYNDHFFGEGRRGLKFLNDPANYPWMLKDPRLCITLRTWLPLLNFVPAVLYTYRHPYDVALSLSKREHYRIGLGLKMWYVYNKRAIQQSQDLCRVSAAHKKIMTNPQFELDRIYEGLRQCGVPVPHKVSPSDVASFIDPKLQHGKSTLKDNSCEKDVSTLLPPDTWQTTEAAHIKLYREAMRVYCALEDGSALKPEFKWDESIVDM
jgi:hypothetical protein